jgi:hypothetical protein
MSNLRGGEDECSANTGDECQAGEERRMSALQIQAMNVKPSQR